MNDNPTCLSARKKRFGYVLPREPNVEFILRVAAYRNFTGANVALQEYCEGRNLTFRVDMSGNVTLEEMRAHTPAGTDVWALARTRQAHRAAALARTRRAYMAATVGAVLFGVASLVTLVLGLYHLA